jgi:predicted nucleic acid-binding protein
VRIEGLILDTGPLVAYLDQDERFHGWAKTTFAGWLGPVVTCEAVLTEAMFLLRRHSSAQSKLLELVVQGVLPLGFELGREIRPVKALWERYDNVPSSLADACLIRLSELRTGFAVCTLDSDFGIYRRHRRQTIPLVMPAELTV